MLREIWHGENVDHITIPVGDGYGTYLMLREELSQFLSIGSAARKSASGDGTLSGVVIGLSRVGFWIRIQGRQR